MVGKKLLEQHMAYYFWLFRLSHIHLKKVCTEHLIIISQKWKEAWKIEAARTKVIRSLYNFHYERPLLFQD